MAKGMLNFGNQSQSVHFISKLFIVHTTEIFTAKSRSQNISCQKITMPKINHFRTTIRMQYDDYIYTCIHLHECCLGQECYSLTCLDQTNLDYVD